MATWFDERALGEGVDLEALVNPSTSAGGGKKKGKKGQTTLLSNSGPMRKS